MCGLVFQSLPPQLLLNPLVLFPLLLLLLGQPSAKTIHLVWSLSKFRTQFSLSFPSTAPKWKLLSVVSTVQRRPLQYHHTHEVQLRKKRLAKGSLSNKTLTDTPPLRLYAWKATYQVATSLHTLFQTAPKMNSSTAPCKLLAGVTSARLTNTRRPQYSPSG